MEPTPPPPSGRPLGQRANQYKRPLWRRILGALTDVGFKDIAGQTNTRFSDRNWRGETNAEESKRIDDARNGRLYQRHARGGRRAERQDPHSFF